MCAEQCSPVCDKLAIMEPYLSRYAVVLGVSHFDLFFFCKDFALPYNNICCSQYDIGLIHSVSECRHLSF